MLMYVRITPKMCFFIVSSYRYDVTTINAVLLENCRTFVEDQRYLYRA